MEESQSRPEGALAHYQDLMKNYPNSPFTSEAAVRVKVLEVKKSPDSPPTGATAPSAASAPASPPESPAKTSGKPVTPTSKKKP